MLCWLLKFITRQVGFVSSFPPFQAFMVSSGTMKASPQGRDFTLSSNLDSLGPVSEMHGVFSNWNLLSASGVNQGQ